MRKIFISNIENEFYKDVKDMEDVLQNIGKNIGKKAIQYTKTEMEKPKHGNVFMLHGSKIFRRSAIGEVIAAEPAFYRLRYNKGPSTHDSLKSKIELIPTSKSNVRKLSVGIEDTSPRAFYKSEYRINKGGRYKKVGKSLVYGRDNLHRIKNGRTSIIYGLLKARDEYKRRYTSDIVKILTTQK